MNNPAAAAQRTYRNGTSKPTPNGKAQHISSENMMQVDSTRDRVYIHDLDAELASDSDTDPDVAPLIFLPDIEARLSRLPKHVLNPDPVRGAGNQELVLYSAPRSLTVDEGHDAVRKAIVEARQRAHERSVEEAREKDMGARYGEKVGAESGSVAGTETAHGYAAGGYEVEEEADPDAMDIG